MKRRSPLSFLLALALPFAAVAAATPALAQTPPPAAAARAAAPRVKIDGRFQRYVLSPKGRPTAMVLQDGTVVSLPRRAGQGAAGSLRPYDAVHVEGGAVKTPTGTVIMRPVVSRDGTVLVDASKQRARHERRKGDQKGERGRRAERDHDKGARAPLSPMTASGRVTGIVSTPRGRPHAILLDDGTTASGFGLDGVPLKVGDRVSVSGKGGAYAQGKALRIQTITLPSGETRTLPSAPKHDRKHERRGDRPAPV